MTPHGAFWQCRQGQNAMRFKVIAKAKNETSSDVSNACCAVLNRHHTVENWFHLCGKIVEKMLH